MPEINDSDRVIKETQKLNLLPVKRGEEEFFLKGFFQFPI